MVRDSSAVYFLLGNALDNKRPRGAASLSLLSLSLSLMRLNGVTYVQTVSMGFSRKSREMANPLHQTGGAKQMWAV